MFIYIKLFFEYPIIAHAIRFPELPVIKLDLLLPCPQSSWSACIINPRPIIFALFPLNLITLSTIVYLAQPFESVFTPFLNLNAH